MKKVILTLIALVTMTFGFVACGGNGGNSGDDAKQQAGLVGNWYYNDNTFYTFNEDGTGSYTAFGSLFGNFTYSEADGQLTLVYEGMDPSVFNYTLEGNVLTILAGESNYGGDTPYTRK